jgi:hypothetical protein
LVVAPVPFQSVITRDSSSWLTLTSSLSMSFGESSCRIEVSTAVRNASGPIRISSAPSAIMVAAEAHSSGTRRRQPRRILPQEMRDAQGGSARATRRLDEQAEWLGGVGQIATELVHETTSS